MNWKTQLLAIANRLRIVGIIIFVLIIGAGAYQVYGIIRESTGMNPSRTITAYFQAFSREDYAQVYDLTAKEDLTDIYGRRIPEDEFITRLAQIANEQAFSFTAVESSKLFETRGRRYYSVTLHAQVGSNTGESRLVVEVRKEGTSWVLTYPFGVIL